MANTGSGDLFGPSIALSASGSTLQHELDLFHEVFGKSLVVVS